MQLDIFSNYRQSLEKLRIDCEKCEKCPYHLRDTRRVHGYGPPDAVIMVVGQGPGPKEMESGVPFSGGSGTLLNKIMASVSIRRRNVYKTNVLKCSQPEDATIMTSAARSCCEWLYDEIGLVKPKVVVCLGVLAAEHVAGVAPGQFAEARGMFLPTRWTSRKGTPTIAVPVYNPAYLLRLRGKSGYKEAAQEEFVSWKAIEAYSRDTPDVLS